MSFKDRVKSWFGRRAVDPAVNMQAVPRAGSVMHLDRNDPLARELMQRMGLIPPDGVDPRVEQARKHLGTDSAGDVLQWAIWENERKVLVADLPGWSPCRFYHRAGASGEEGRGVFGAVKGDYGIWRQPFSVCDYAAEEHDDVVKPNVILPALTYLPSGLDLGCFADVSTAAAATEVAITLDWSRLPAIDYASQACAEAWRAHMAKLRQTWAFNGIAVEPFRHAHDRFNPDEAVSIFGRVDPGADKPKVVS